MEAFKTWEEMTTLEQYACTYWSMYKDAYGVRPRGIDTSSWTEADFEREFLELSVTIAEEDRVRKEAEERAAHDFERRMLSLQKVLIAVTSIFAILGFVLVSCAVAAVDAASLSAVLWYAFFGLLIMWWGVEAMKSVDKTNK